MSTFLLEYSSEYLN